MTQQHWRWQPIKAQIRDPPQTHARDEVLDTMNAIVPWAELRGVVEPQYPRAAMAVRRLSREFILGGRRRFGVGAVVVMTSDSNNPPWQLPGMRNAEQIHDELKRAAVVAFPLNERRT
jgi:hypothetical protein